MTQVEKYIENGQNGKQYHENREKESIDDYLEKCCPFGNKQTRNERNVIQHFLL
jgi:hypothetical protein